MPTSCLALDISLGCSGWVYAMSVITSLMQSGMIKKGLLLAGDTPSKFCSKTDKSTFPLFGDAGTATALEFSMTEEEKMVFVLNGDGSGSKAINIGDGGYRNEVSIDSFKKETHGDGIERSKLDLVLDGMSVFSFGISKAPKVVIELIDNFNIDKEKIDLFTFHQANLFMNEKIRKKLKLPEEKVLYCLKEFGNTSCASIPLTLVTKARQKLKTENLSHIGCGFGVGLSWGAIQFNTKKIIVPELLEI